LIAAYGKISSGVKGILQNVDESNSHLIKLVDEFLNITRIEQGRTKYEFKDVDINTVIDSVYKELHTRAEQHGLKLAWKPETNLPKIYLKATDIIHIARFAKKHILLNTIRKIKNDI
jgi:signal transduction histidine kinase